MTCVGLRLTRLKQTATSAVRHWWCKNCFSKWLDLLRFSLLEGCVSDFCWRWWSIVVLVRRYEVLWRVHRCAVWHRVLYRPPWKWREFVACQLVRRGQGIGIVEIDPLCRCGFYRGRRRLHREGWGSVRRLLEHRHVGWCHVISINRAIPITMIIEIDVFLNVIRHFKHLLRWLNALPYTTFAIVSYSWGRSRFARHEALPLTLEERAAPVVILLADHIVEMSHSSAVLFWLVYQVRCGLIE